MLLKESQTGRLIPARWTLIGLGKEHYVSLSSHPGCPPPPPLLPRHILPAVDQPPALGMAPLVIENRLLVILTMSLDQGYYSGGSLSLYIIYPKHLLLSCLIVMST